MVANDVEEQLRKLLDPWNREWCLRLASKSILGLVWPWGLISWLP